MTSLKVQKPAVGTSLFGKKEPAIKITDAAASKGSKSAPKKPASKPSVPKKKAEKAAKPASKK
uniref:Uncharacterized protein n=1 Tax=Kalanchoe fedtschenkoi TaxID=63787 RepID=A0A7N0UFI3_KALFE